jgi:hypothetical protein
MPRYHVSRFHTIPPARPAKTTVSVMAVASTILLAMVAAGDLGVHFLGPLVDVRPDVAPLGRGVSLQLRPLRPGGVGGLGDLPPCVLD